MPRITKSSAVVAASVVAAAGGALVPSVASAADHPTAVIQSVDGQKPFDYVDHEYVYTTESDRPFLLGWAVAATTIRFVEGQETLCEVHAPAQQSVGCAATEALSEGRHHITAVTVQDSSEQRWGSVVVEVAAPKPTDLRAVTSQDGAVVTGVTAPGNTVQAQSEFGATLRIGTADADGRFSVVVPRTGSGERVLVRAGTAWHWSGWATATVSGDPAEPEPVVPEPSDDATDPGSAPRPRPGDEDRGEAAADAPVRVTDVAADGAITLTATARAQTRFVVLDEEGTTYANIAASAEGTVARLRNVPSTVQRLVVQEESTGERSTLAIPGR